MADGASAPRTILLVDDHQMFRTGLRLFIERRQVYSVVGEASSAGEALQLAAATKPDVALVDINLPDMNGIMASRRLLEVSPATRILIVSSEANPALVHEAMVVGVAGYVIKTNAADELERAVEAVLAGKVYLCAEVSTAVLGNYRNCFSAPTDAEPRLSAREVELLRLIAEGKRNKEIADDLGVTPKSAETFRLRLMKKLQLDSTAALTRYAIRQGLIKP